jgi:pantothenate kinase
MDMQRWSDRARALVPPSGRGILGIVGPPGSGKSTFVEELVAELGSPFAAVVPMDGFHMSNRVLDELGLRHRKGVLESFDAHGYLSLIQRARESDGAPLLAPNFDRTLDDPVAASIRVTPETRLVITEGIYLLEGSDPWPGLRPLLDEVWYLQLDDEVRRARLRARHERFGRSPADAAAWVRDVDEPNARRIVARRELADLIIPVS